LEIRVLLLWGNFISFKYHHLTWPFRHKVPDILDSIQADKYDVIKRESSVSQNQFRKTNPYFENVLTNQNSGIQNYFEGLNSPMSNAQSSFMGSSKLNNIQTPSHKSNFESKVDSLTDINTLPVRVRGKKGNDTKSEDTKFAQAIQVKEIS